MSDDLLKEIGGRIGQMFLKLFLAIVESCGNDVNGSSWSVESPPAHFGGGDWCGDGRGDDCRGCADGSCCTWGAPRW